MASTRQNQLIVIIGLILLSIAQNVNATWRLKIGGNYSYLKEPSYGEPGMSYIFGITKDWSLYRWIQLRTELLMRSEFSSRLYHDCPPFYFC